MSGEFLGDLNLLGSLRENLLEVFRAETDRCLSNSVFDYILSTIGKLDDAVDKRQLIMRIVGANSAPRISLPNIVSKYGVESCIKTGFTEPSYFGIRRDVSHNAI